MKWTTRRALSAIVIAVSLAVASGARAQNAIQWGGNARSAIEDAKDQMVPLVFWVTESSRGDRDLNDLEDAQEESFRDPAVVAIVRKHFIPVRVARNSRVLEYAKEFGLPTNYGMYIAVLSPSGKVLAEINPGDVAEPHSLAQRLSQAFAAFRDVVYSEQVQPVLANPESPRASVRSALDLVWRLDIARADEQVIGLFARPDVSPAAKRKIYSLLATLATEKSVTFLLEKSATDRDAKVALAGAEGGSLAVLLRELPQPDVAGASTREPGPGLTERQRVAYDAVCAIANAGPPRPQAFWEKNPARSQAEELAAVRARAEAVLAYWNESVGHYR